ncbi:unnamed protein product [Prunus armeniaca]
MLSSFLTRSGVHCSSSSYRTPALSLFQSLSLILRHGHLSSCASSFFSSHGFSSKGFLGFEKKAFLNLTLPGQHPNPEVVVQEVHRQSLADCAIGFGQYALGGKGGEYYIVTDSSNDDAVNPRPGTLRYAVIQTEPLWIVFPGNMLIKLSQELIFNSCKTLDCRGANVHIVGCGCITWQFISNVIIHNVHIHHCYPSVDKLRSFLRQLPLFSNAFLVGGAEDFFIIELADQVDIFFTGQLQKLKVEPAHKTSPGFKASCEPGIMVASDYRLIYCDCCFAFYMLRLIDNFDELELYDTQGQSCRNCLRSQLRWPESLGIIVGIVFLVLRILFQFFNFTADSNFKGVGKKLFPPIEG